MAIFLVAQVEEELSFFFCSKKKNFLLFYFSISDLLDIECKALERERERICF